VTYDKIKDEIVAKQKYRKEGKVPGNTAYVLDAGFTKAFLPKAPLLVDRYDTDAMLSRLDGCPEAQRILKLEMAHTEDGKIDIERLMTRLDGRMPYDIGDRINSELTILLADLKNAFKRKLDHAKRDLPGASEDLGKFARHCVENKITCITFNYDDVLDQAFWEVEKVEYGVGGGRPYWHPDGGYGFFCRVADSTVASTPQRMDKTSMLLLKLHGSMNWRVKLGSARPYDVEAVVHYQDWFPTMHRKADPVLVERHLEQDPFIVPPVLVKSALVAQPILRVIWSQAKLSLASATEVIFVGYSLPVTDLAASFLFLEALDRRNTNIKVVNVATTPESRKPVHAAYRRLFPGLSDQSFDFRGAHDWANEIASQSTVADKVPGGDQPGS
jgi:hypothetical protein